MLLQYNNINCGCPSSQQIYPKSLLIYKNVQLKINDNVSIKNSLSSFLITVCF